MPKICPRCKKGFLVKRINKNTGKKFWACSLYPKCKFTKPLKYGWEFWYKVILIVGLIIAFPTLYLTIHSIKNINAKLTIKKITPLTAGTTLDNVLPYRNITKREYYVSLDSAKLEIVDNKLQFIINNPSNENIYIPKIIINAKVKKRLIKYNYPELYPSSWSGTELGGSLIYKINLNGQDTSIVVFDATSNDSIYFFNSYQKPSLISFYIRSIPGFVYDLYAGFVWFTDNDKKEKIQWTETTKLIFPLCINWYDLVDSYVDTIRIYETRFKALAQILNVIMQEYDGRAKIIIIFNPIWISNYIIKVQKSGTINEKRYLQEIFYSIKYISFFNNIMKLQFYLEEVNNNDIKTEKERYMIFGKNSILLVSTEADSDYVVAQKSDYHILPRKVIYSRDSNFIYKKINDFSLIQNKLKKINYEDLVFYSTGIKLNK